jgi:hypothetical protein
MVETTLEQYIRFPIGFHAAFASEFGAMIPLLRIHHDSLTPTSDFWFEIALRIVPSSNFYTLLVSSLVPLYPVGAVELNQLRRPALDGREIYHARPGPARMAPIV